MFKLNDKGFFLAELLLSLAGLLLLALTLVPLYLEIVENHAEEQERHAAHHFLYEELISAKIEERPPTIENGNKNDYDFVMTERVVGDREEVCIFYGKQSKRAEICEFVS